MITARKHLKFNAYPSRNCLIRRIINWIYFENIVIQGDHKVKMWYQGERYLSVLGNFLLPVVAHCGPLLLIVAHCCLFLLIVAHCLLMGQFWTTALREWRSTATFAFLFVRGRIKGSYEHDNTILVFLKISDFWALQGSLCWIDFIACVLQRLYD